MDSATRSRLHDVTLQARQLLVGEVQQMLEGVYGLHRSGSFEPPSNLPAVQSLPEVNRTWERLKNYLADERDAGLNPEDALSKLAKEVAFTWLNRLVAFKMLEARRLVRGTLDRYHDSNAFKFYLSDHPQDLTLFNAGDSPQDALGEGPRDVAYRHFLLDQCRDMAGQIKVLFDPDNLPSRLFPRPRALRDLIALLNDPALGQAWQPGSEEAVGWVYQYFNELEKAQIYARLSKGGKVSYGEIPIITQLYTPRWIVRALVENSLGRLWLKLHPESRLKEQMSYLIPIEKDEARSQRDEEPEVRLAKALTFLDPACGSMHFGIVAFDLLFQMYQEEFENVGRHGWPEVPSVSDPMDIPASIIANNLFGIDIDPRAVQLSALALLLKARSYNSRARITDHNLACADILLGDAPKLSRLISAIKEKYPTLGRILQAVSAELGKTHLLGSLTPEGGELQKAIEAERVRYEAERTKPHLPGMVPEEYVFEVEADDPRFWANLEDRAIEAFDQVAQYIDGRDQQKGISEEYFTEETVKAIRFARFIFRKYDVVATNPPYLSNRVLKEDLRDRLNKHYPDSKSDFYTAFIERCCSFARSQATVAMITQQSFMFISSYEKLRKKLRQTVAIRAMVHTGPRAFAEIGGEKVNTTLFILDKQLSPTHRDNAVAIYFRLIKAPRAEAKRTGFEHAPGHLRAGDSDEAVYRYRQGDFDAIPGAPWVYWITPGLKALFTRLPKLEDLSQPRVGLQTGDNFRFLRYWWEVGLSDLGRGCLDPRAALLSGKRWFPYMKGGSYRRWFGNQNTTVNWFKDGAEIQVVGIENGRIASRPQNTSFYFRIGITYSYLTSSKFTARLSPGGFIFDVAGSSLFPPDLSLVLAAMNSAFAAYALRLINPTVNFQVGDLARLPIPTTSSPTLNPLVEEAIALARAESEEDETTYDFIAPPDWHTGLDDVAARKARLAEVEREIDEEVYRLYGISDEDREAIEEELSAPSSLADGQEAAQEAEQVAAEGEDVPQEALGQLTRQELARRWVSYAVGVVLGRFEPGVEGALGRGQFSSEVAGKLWALSDADGLVVLDPGHRDDLTAKVERVLETIYGYEGAEEISRAATCDKSLADYLKNDFFKRHVQQYRKRPIYWLLQSPKKGYSLYAFHEKLTRDRLFLISGNAYLGGKTNGVRTQVEESRQALPAAEGKERKRIEKELEGREALLLDLEAFARNLSAATSTPNERGQQVGWQPEIDDGVLLNLAPLYTLIPAWSAEPKKAWEALARGDYDWSHTAMRYWPDRVVAACRTNKSYVIAHNRMDVYAGGK